MHIYKKTEPKVNACQSGSECSEDKLLDLKFEEDFKFTDS